MDLIAQINRLKHRLNEQARVINAASEEAKQVMEAINNLTILEENNATMIKELIDVLKEAGVLEIKEKQNFTIIDGGKK